MTIGDDPNYSDLNMSVYKLVKEAYEAGRNTALETAAVKAEGFIIKQHHAGDNISITQSNIAKDIAAAIRKIEVE